MFDPRPDFGRPDAGLLAALRSEPDGSPLARLSREPDAVLEQIEAERAELRDQGVVESHWFALRRSTSRRP